MSVNLVALPHVTVLAAYIPYEHVVFILPLTYTPIAPDTPPPECMAY